MTARRRRAVIGRGLDGAQRPAGHTEAYTGRMSRELARIAQDVGCSERTVRRYVGEGLLRSRSVLSSRHELSEEEQSYLSSHWRLLAGMKHALRTERDVRLAVLFGSTAVGEDRPDSDLDVLVVRRSTTARAKAGLSIRLSRALSKRVHLVDLEHAEESPALLADVVLEGRPLIDRDGLWGGLLDRRAEIISRARAAEAALAARAHEAVLTLTSGLQEADVR